MPSTTPSLSGIGYAHPSLSARTAPADLLPPSLLHTGAATLSPAALSALTARLAAAPPVWRPVVRHDPRERWFTRLLLTDAVEIWLIGWAAGQGTPVHDHGGALGSMTVADGLLVEDVYDGAWRPVGIRRHAAGATVGFGRHHIHRVTAPADGFGTSVHAYSPPSLPLTYGSPAGELVGARS